MYDAAALHGLRLEKEKGHFVVNLCLSASVHVHYIDDHHSTFSSKALHES